MRDALGAVEQAVEDGVCDGGIAQPCVPMLDGQLAGNEGGLAGTVVDDFQQIVSSIGVAGHHVPVVEDQDVDARELAESAAAAAVGVGDVEHFG